MRSIKELCRELRKRQTPAENALWALLRNRKLQGYKFLRQHPLAKVYSQGRKSFYIADFYCVEKKLVVEADGPIHQERVEYDKNRDEVLESYKIPVLRFLNEQILKQPDVVIGEILRVLER